MSAQIIPFPGAAGKPDALDQLAERIRSHFGEGPVDENHLSRLRRAARTKGKRLAKADSLRAAVVVEQMKDYRILSRRTMRSISLAQIELVKCVQAYKTSGLAPEVEKLEALMWEYADSFRCIDWAHKFLVVHGEPVGDSGDYEDMRSQFSREISHLPPSRIDRVTLD